MYIAKESFLGVNSEAGFYSLFEDFINKRSRVYVIKGGPGTGKSTLMRSIGKQAEQRGLEVEYLHCSSRPRVARRHIRQGARRVHGGRHAAACA